MKAAVARFNAAERAYNALPLGFEPDGPDDDKEGGP
jgi:hypothetical protein